jgi:hypothetical protein
MTPSYGDKIKQYPGQQNVSRKPNIAGSIDKFVKILSSQSVNNKQFGGLKTSSN